VIIKKFISLILFIGFTQVICAQDSPYLFGFSSEYYLELQNPESVNKGEVWGPDDQFAIPIGFDVEITGRVFSTVVINAGIGITLVGNNSPRLWIWADEWGGGKLLSDRGTDVSESPIDYELTGEPGERILKIQWINAGIIDHGGDDPDDFVNFQIWIYESSNILEVHYGASQTSDLSFGYNEGPGVRFWNIEDNWGICVYDYQNAPSWQWIEFDGPYGGCMIDGAPNEQMVFVFYPSSTVAVNETVANNQVGFSVAYNSVLKEFFIQIEEFEQGKTYDLSIYNGLGEKLNEIILDSKKSRLSGLGYKRGLYVFVLSDDAGLKTQKLILP